MSYQQILKRLSALEVEVVVLREENAMLKAENKTLKKKVMTLEKQLDQSREKLSKNSSNSSIPPSQDPFRKKRSSSLREKSGKKSGGQEGHKGEFLKMSEAPDKIVEHHIEKCKHCNESLSTTKDVLVRRQVIDIPSIQPIITEHRIYKTQCTCCGTTNKSSFPQDVQGSVSYGNNVEQLIAYLNVRQYMPYNRIKEFLSQYCSIDMSEGTIDNKLNKLSNKFSVVYESIRKQVEQQSWLGSDETSMIVDGKTHWMWVWQNEQLSYLRASPSRGFTTAQTTFPNGLLESILVSDRLGAQLKQDASDNQVCIAHLLRELKSHLDAGRVHWFKDFKTLLFDAINLGKQIDYQKHDQFRAQISKLEYRKSELLNQELIQDTFAHSMQKQMKKVADKLFTFLYYEDVPSDNNSSERAIRNAKVKQKVSGMFKTQRGMQIFAILRSIIDTGIKRGFDVFTTL